MIVERTNINSLFYKELGKELGLMIINARK